ncbi:MAG: hypothetical protein JWP89_5404 [Schlesneria sp.]|nr:hypothetical protein [Schlesneria sp.]
MLAYGGSVPGSAESQFVLALFVGVGGAVVSRRFDGIEDDVGEWDRFAIGRHGAGHSSELWPALAASDSDDEEQRA